jgi:CheY-like chemotaxis protein
MESRSTILLVEDNPDDALFFQRALRESGWDYDLQVVPGSGEAIDYLQRACRGGEVPGCPLPKFMFLDGRLPRGDGPDVLLWMSERSIYSMIPTVVLSGSDRPGDVKRAFELGVHGYFVKPLRPGGHTDMLKLIFQYWATSSVPPVGEFEHTVPGAEAVPKPKQP